MLDNNLPVWQSTITAEMLSDLDLNEADIQSLVEELNDAVMEIAGSYGIQ